MTNNNNTNDARLEVPAFLKRGSTEWQAMEAQAKTPQGIANKAAWDDSVAQHNRAEADKANEKSALASTPDAPQHKELPKQSPKCEDCASPRQGGAFAEVASVKEGNARKRKVSARVSWLCARRKEVVRDQKRIGRTSWGQKEAEALGAQADQLSSDIRAARARISLLVRHIATLKETQTR